MFWKVSLKSRFSTTAILKSERITFEFHFSPVSFKGATSRNFRQFLISFPDLAGGRSRRRDLVKSDLYVIACQECGRRVNSIAFCFEGFDIMEY